MQYYATILQVNKWWKNNISFLYFVCIYLSSKFFNAPSVNVEDKRGVALVIDEVEFELEHNNRQPTDLLLTGKHLSSDWCIRK